MLALGLSDAQWVNKTNRFLKQDLSYKICVAWFYILYFIFYISDFRLHTRPKTDRFVHQHLLFIIVMHQCIHWRKPLPLFSNTLMRCTFTFTCCSPTCPQSSFNSKSSSVFPSFLFAFFFWFTIWSARPKDRSENVISKLGDRWLLSLIGCFPNLDQISWFILVLKLVVSPCGAFPQLITASDNHVRAKLLPVWLISLPRVHFH